ncbi:MAG: hypothetical protein AUI36_41655 [Cyanobacteria bacterium 13_1_40CM_2_61_4]|nr:MAG: hypothetical protein AUI36_41655 [Cyanobacteria bacterium 13_1_40CM_2_61_4]
MHQQIEEQEMIERYARNQLAPEERRAFEEHFFSCEECFEKLQATERFIAGVRDAGARGMLNSGIAGTAPARTWRAWMLPTLAAGYAALLVSVVFGGWMFFSEMPKLHRQLNQASADANAQRETIAALEKQVASATQAETNVPLVMLQATRDAQAAVSEAVLPEGAAHLVLWVEVPAGKFRSFRLKVETSDHRPVATLDHLQRNSYGALAASLPAERLQPSEFRIMLTGEEPPPASLLAEYRLRIRRP